MANGLASGLLQDPLSGATAFQRFAIGFSDPTALGKSLAARRQARLTAAMFAAQRLPMDHPSRARVQEILDAEGMGVLGEALRPTRPTAETLQVPATSRIISRDPTTGAFIEEVGPVFRPEKPSQAETRRNRLVDLTMKKREKSLSERESVELDLLTKEFEKATAIVGRTPEDVAVKDPVRRRNLKDLITKNALLKTRIGELIEDIRVTPEAVGGIAGAREAAGGMIGQVADLLGGSEGIRAIADLISPEELTRIRSKAAGLKVPALELFGAPPYSNLELEEAKRNFRVLETTSDSAQALTALSEILSLVESKDKPARMELREGFNETFRDDRDIEREGFSVGTVYVDKNSGEKAVYIGVNPEDPFDPANWKPIGRGQ